jgi:hypothetical protein
MKPLASSMNNITLPLKLDPLWIENISTFFFKSAHERILFLEWGGVQGFSQL